jgi:hypothetical protein
MVLKWLQVGEMARKAIDRIAYRLNLDKRDNIVAIADMVIALTERVKELEKHVNL